MILEKLSKYINNELITTYPDYNQHAIHTLLKYFGNPERFYPTIHIAGTNGKGSVAYMLSEVLKRAGYTTGLYTSPHLLSINERISINTIAITDERLNRYLDECEEGLKKNKGIQPTFFDLLTLFAFRYFQEKSVDIAIIETGLGGRLDSTNVILPLCSIITDIDYDHTKVLGKNLSQIAKEKAGIIKNDTPVITSNRNSQVLKVLKKKACDLHSPFFLIDRDYKVNHIKRSQKNLSFDFLFQSAKYNCHIKNIQLPFLPLFQVVNSAMVITATTVIKNVFPRISERVVRAGLKNVIIPGRFELLSKRPLMLFDPAHNYQALSSIISEIVCIYPNKKLVVILSMMKDKDYRSVFTFLNELHCDVIYYNLGEPRNYTLKNTGYFSVVNSVSLLKRRLSVYNKSEICVLFTGTFRLYAVAREFCNMKARDLAF